MYFVLWNLFGLCVSVGTLGKIKEKKGDINRFARGAILPALQTGFCTFPFGESAMHISAKQASPTTSTNVELELQYRTLTFLNILSNMRPCMAGLENKKIKKSRTGSFVELFILHSRQFCL